MLLRGEQTGEADNPMLRAARRQAEEISATPAALATLLLAHHLRAARRMVMAFYTDQGRAAPDLTYQVAAPLETATPAEADAPRTDDKSGPTLDAFARCAFLAEAMSRELPEGDCWDAADAVCLYELLDEEYATLPEDALRKTFVMPETQAGMLGLSPTLAPGLHAVVDIGAGTTDVAVFRRGKGGEGVRPATSYYGDRVLPRAATHADLLLGLELQKRHADQKRGRDGRGVAGGGSGREGGTSPFPSTERAARSGCRGRSSTRSCARWPASSTATTRRRCGRRSARRT